MIDEADRAAIQILAAASERIMLMDGAHNFDAYAARKILHHAVRHLAYPDRAVYPKVRGSRKGHPVERH